MNFITLNLITNLIFIFMKKQFIVLAALMCFGLTVINAQTSIGLRVGTNLNKFSYSGEDATDDFTEFQKSNAGLNFAIPVEFKFSNSFAVQPELSFNQKGEKTSIDFLGLKVTTKTIFNYLELPILGKYMFGTEKIQANILAGPSFGYALNGKVVEGDESEKIDLSDEDVSYNRFDFAAQFGAGVSVNAGPGKVFLDARYYLGLSNLNSDKDYDLKINNRGIGINIGYLYTLGGK